MPAQLFAAPVYFQASAGQVSWPGSPGRGMVWKLHRERSRPHVEGPDVAGRSRQRFAGRAPDDQQVLIDDAGRGEADRFHLARPQVLAQIDPSRAAERGDRASPVVASIE